MKRLIIILLLFPFFIHSQKKSSSNNVPTIKVRKNTSLTIETISSDVLYIGTNNILTLQGQSLSQYSVTIDNGTLTPNYTLTNDSIRAFDISVSNTNPTFVSIDNGHSAYKQKYRNKSIPDPQIYLSSKERLYYGKEISDTEFRNISSLNATIFGFDYYLIMRIVSFKVKKVTSDNQILNFTQRTGDIRAITKTAKAGDIFIFYDVLVEMCEPKEQRPINGLTFIII